MFLVPARPCAASRNLPAVPSRPITVVQWTTGNVGRRALRAVLRAPHLELVGVFAHSADKVGVDAGALCGEAPSGVLATADVDAAFTRA